MFLTEQQENHKNCGIDSSFPNKFNDKRDGHHFKPFFNERDHLGRLLPKK